MVVHRTAQASRSRAGATESYPFDRGFPTGKAARNAHDDVMSHRALAAYHFWYPAVSTEAVFNGCRQNGITDNECIGLLVVKPHHLMFAASADTPYAFAVLDLVHGPVMIELPSGPFTGIVTDHNARSILEMGLTGSDAIRGGRYMVLPPFFDGAAPDGYIAGRSQTLKALLVIHVLPSDGDIRSALESLRRVRVFPHATDGEPASMRFVDLTDDRSLDTTLLDWEDNIQFWQRLHEIIEYEPIVEPLLVERGLLASIGIEKGKRFAPDARMTAILERTALDGRTQMLISAFASERRDRVAWPDRQWEWDALVADRGNFETAVGIDLEARDRWFAVSQACPSSMYRREVGAGALSWMCFRDADGEYLDGGNSYTLTVPLPVPARNFWSVTVYDAVTRSMIQTDQDHAALRSERELKERGDTTINLHFGVKPPAHGEAQWIRTIAGKGWFAILRTYGPEAAALDGAWKPGDFALVET